MGNQQLKQFVMKNQDSSWCNQVWFVFCFLLRETRRKFRTVKETRSWFSFQLKSFFFYRKFRSEIYFLVRHRFASQVPNSSWIHFAELSKLNFVKLNFLVLFRNGKERKHLTLLNILWHFSSPPCVSSSVSILLTSSVVCFFQREVIQLYVGQAGVQVKIANRKCFLFVHQIFTAISN